MSAVRLSHKNHRYSQKSSAAPPPIPSSPSGIVKMFVSWFSALSRSFASALARRRLRTISTRSGSDLNKDENEVAADDAVLYTLPVRQALIKIQAHARGFAARKEYHCLWYDTTKAATLMQSIAVLLGRLGFFILATIKNTP